MYFFIHKCQKIRLGLIFILLLSTNALFANSEDIGLPDFGDSAGSVISPTYERRLGQMFLKQVRQFSSIISDPEVESYIQALGHNLSSHTDNVEQPFKFFVIDNPTINAFAGPGGMIGINSGVILNSGNESELAGVIAHEIAHVTQRHLARNFEEAKKYSLPTAAAMIGALIIATQDPAAGQAAITGIAGLSIQNQINFTRENEEEADRIGISLLAKAGYDPRGMPLFFEKLQKLSKFSQSNAPDFTRTHPLTTSRIADTRARAESFPEKSFRNSHAYELIRHKLLVNSLQTPKEAILFLRDQLEKYEGNLEEKLPIRYGLAYAYIADRAFAHANQQIKHLLKNDSNDVAYLLLAAKLETEQSKYDAAFKIYKKAYELFPDYKPVVMAYGRSLMDVGRAKETRDIMKNYERHHSHDLNTYALLGQAESTLGNEIETAILHAEYYYLAGETKLAVEKLNFIKQRYKMDYYQEQRVAARLSELEYELELEEDIKL